MILAKHKGFIFQIIVNRVGFAWFFICTAVKSSTFFTFSKMVVVEVTSDTVFPEAFRGGPTFPVWFLDSGQKVTQKNVRILSRESLK